MKICSATPTRFSIIFCSEIFFKVWLPLGSDEFLLLARPPSVPIWFVPRKSHIQAGLATSCSIAKCIWRLLTIELKYIRWTGKKLCKTPSEQQKSSIFECTDMNYGALYTIQMTLRQRNINMTETLYFVLGLCDIHGLTDQIQQRHDSHLPCHCCYWQLWQACCHWCSSRPSLHPTWD